MKKSHLILLENLVNKFAKDIAFLKDYSLLKNKFLIGSILRSIYRSYRAIYNNAKKTHLKFEQELNIMKSIFDDKNLITKISFKKLRLKKNSVKKIHKIFLFLLEKRTTNTK